MNILDKAINFMGLQRKHANTMTKIQVGSITNTTELARTLGLLGGDCDSSFSVSAANAYDYYAKTEPIRDSIDKIKRAVAALPLVVTSLDGDDSFQDKHPVLDYLKAQKSEILLSELAMSSLLTEEMWAVGRGLSLNKEPLELIPIRPYDVYVESALDDADGLPYVLRVDSPKDQRRYFKHWIGDQVRFLDTDSDMNSANELFYSVGTAEPVEQFRGLSRLTALKFDADNIFYGNIHNSALLKNRMRPGAIIAPKDNANASQSKFETLVKSIKVFQKLENRGKSAVLNGAIELFKVMEKNVDADYLNLTDKAENRVYSLYNIPLPLVNTKTMTLSNYESAQFAFYDAAVTPESNIVFNFLSDILKLRAAFDQKIGFNPHAVKALQQRQAERMKDLRASQALSTTEIRATAGYPEKPEKGEVLVSSTLVPENSSEAVSQFAANNE
jgi:phage portal protein BeeE